MALRECDDCHEVDELPHHQLVVPDDSGGMIVESRHFACCAAAGCPDGTCNQILSQGAPGV